MLVILGKHIVSAFSSGSDLYALIVGLYVVMVSLTGLNRFRIFLADFIQTRYRAPNRNMISIFGTLMTIFGKMAVIGFVGLGVLPAVLGFLYYSILAEILRSNIHQTPIASFSAVPPPPLPLRRPDSSF